MAYSFLGVAIVADIFMSAIEAVTKRRKRKRLKSGTVVTVYVWNDTVANLSLMALGSSAPEIFLSLIDLLRTGFRASDLGSATIVGSAAFNLLVIVAVCIVSIPGDETRLIEQYAVFIVTGIFSLFAYLWLAFILVVMSPNVVEIWEALITLLLLPVLIWVSYIADIGLISCGANWVIGQECLEEAKERRSTKRFSRASAQASASQDSEGSGKAADKSDVLDAGIRFSVGSSASDDRPTKSVLRSIGSTEKSTTFSVDVGHDDSEDIGDEGDCKTNLRSMDTKNNSLKRSEDPPQRHSVRSMSNTSFASSRSARASLGQKKADTWKKSQLTRGFSMASQKSEITDETTAKSYQRRKSIAAHHNQAVKRFVKKGVNNAQTGLGSQLSINTTATTATSNSGNKGPEDEEEDEYSGSSTEVQLLIDRMFVSSSLSSKTVTVLRTGTVGVSLCVQYQVDCCKRASTRLQQTRVQCARLPKDKRPRPKNEDSDGPETSNGDGEVVEWLEHVESEEAFQGSFIIAEDVREKKLMIENPGMSSGGCYDFVVTLLSVEITEVPEGPAVTAQLGRIRSTYVMSDPNVAPELQSGMFSWGVESMFVNGRSKKQHVEAVVVRHCGCLNRVSLHWETEALSAVPDVDYVEAGGTLNFDEGVSEMTIPLTILQKKRGRIPREFLVVLSPVEDDPNDFQPKFSQFDDGGEDSAIMTVVIGERKDDPAGLIKSLDWIFNLNHLVQGCAEWKDAAVSSIFIGGSWEESKQASVLDWVFHLVTLPWSVLFSMIPPTSFFGGWFCFYVCLIFIGTVTGLVADLAELFGCVCDIPDIITAITFVALGTSMPDLFASKVAAQEDPTADASIVNVTGSNSVNVFLGLGLPWSLAAIYWNVKDRTAEWISEYPDVAAQYPGSKCVFAVPSANLGFSIVSFCCACFGAITLLVVRRRSVGGELGGPPPAKVSSSLVLVLYWLGYVAVVSWRALRYGEASSKEEMAVCGGLFVVECSFTCLPLFLLRAEAKRNRREREEEAKQDAETAARTAANEALSTIPSSGFFDETAPTTPTSPEAASGHNKSPTPRGASTDGDMPVIPLEPPAQPFSTPVTYKNRAMQKVTVVE